MFGKFIELLLLLSHAWKMGCEVFLQLNVLEKNINLLKKGWKVLNVEQE
jgi:hypothetical protein